MKKYECKNCGSEISSTTTTNKLGLCPICGCDTLGEQVKPDEESEKCKFCGCDMYVKEIEVYGELKEVGVYCDNKACNRWSILIA